MGDFRFFGDYMGEAQMSCSPCGATCYPVSLHEANHWASEHLEESGICK